MNRKSHYQSCHEALGFGKFTFTSANRNKAIRIAFFVFANCFLHTASVSSQSIERSVISSFGFSYSGAAFQSDCTVGEVIIASGGNGTIKITQGFQQPFMMNATCLGDFDMNGVVNVSDLLIFSSAFGCASNCGLPDMDDNGAVNVSDLLIFTSVFGTICS